jgi:hypothetical protein
VLRSRPDAVRSGSRDNRRDRRSATITLTRHDPVAQRITKQHITLSGQGMRLLPVAQRYCWPREPDLMAQLAGCDYGERDGDWTRTAFDSSSHGHVSVYELIWPNGVAGVRIGG